MMTHYEPKLESLSKILGFIVQHDCTQIYWQIDIVKSLIQTTDISIVQKLQLVFIMLVSFQTLFIKKVRYNFYFSSISVYSENFTHQIFFDLLFVK